MAELNMVTYMTEEARRSVTLVRGVCGLTKHGNIPDRRVRQVYDFAERGLWIN